MTWSVVTNQIEVFEKLESCASVVGEKLIWYKSFKELQEESFTGIVLIPVTKQELVADLQDVFSLFPTLTLSTVPILIDFENVVDIRRAIRAGAFDVLPYPFQNELLVAAAREAEEILNQKKDISKKEAPIKNARVMTVCSTKGGVGKTTFTVNLAAALAKQFNKIIVIDLDLQFGDVAMFFDSKPKKTIYEWVKEDYNNSPEKVKGYIHSVNDFIDIMAAPIRPEFSEVILEEHITRLISSLKQYYDIVLIDTAPYIEEKILTALERSDDIFLVTYLDLPTLKNCKIFIDTLQSLALDKKVKIILNRDSKRKGLYKETAENVLGMPVHTRVPDFEKIVVASVNEGNPFVYSYPRAKISKVLYSFAQELAGKQEKAIKKGFFFKKAASEGRLI
ncbi:AAA family ATPase [Bacillus sp. FJAT-27245]|uniref:AAA family ATPase n=1 Tax=Bacillus sp. FJAT-27245 TaxID=1684144 RepID=UPI0006A7DE59|nr:AAA family ATPase [Bacillus sp. FJAT-27245]